MISIRTATGDEARSVLPQLATLRMQVFRQWPYLYDGDAQYEQNYLSTYAASPDAVFVLAFDGIDLVGCATGVPLKDEPDHCRAPFEHAGVAIDQVFYFGESVLLDTWRGRGIGHRFFDERERCAKELGYPITAFCAVVRHPADPRRPALARSLDTFWHSRGYHPVPAMKAQFSWRELGEAQESAKEMQFWLRRS